MEVSDEPHTPAALPPGEKHPYTLIRKHGGHQSRSGRFGEEKSLAYSEYNATKFVCYYNGDQRVFELAWTSSLQYLCLTSEAQRNHFLVKLETRTNKHATGCYEIYKRVHILIFNTRKQLRVQN
jgi:hypothetical protein